MEKPEGNADSRRHAVPRIRHNREHPRLCWLTTLNSTYHSRATCLAWAKIRAMKTMKALRFRSFGGPEVLSIEEIEIPTPAAGEALVQVKAAAINPSDIKNVSGAFKATTMPRIPGRDFAGVVVSGRQHVGEVVWGSVPGFGITRDGAHAEFVIVPEAALSVKPADLTAEQAAAVGVPYTTAWGVLVSVGQLRPGETVLIVGAAGMVGQAATQIANWKAARVLGATRGTSPLTGVAAVIDTSAGDLPERVFELTHGKGADFVFDTVGGAMFEPALRSLSREGRQIAIASTGTQRVSFNLVDFYHNDSRLIGFDSYALSVEEVAEIFEHLRAGFETKALSPPPVETVPFERAIDAYKAIASGRSGAKLVISFSGLQKT
jgi:NADPH2:quinone reductase